MPPKKDDKKGKQETSAPLDGVQAELAALLHAKTDLELAQAMLIDKLQQAKAEHEQMLQQITQLKARIGNSTQDYVDILQHRGEQIKAAEGRASSLQQQVDRLQQEIASAAIEAASLKDANAGQAARLDDAAALLADKDRLEETVKKQHALIEQRGTEVKVLKAQLEGKEAALDKARSEMEELSLKCQSSTQLLVLFGETWLLHVTHVRLRGAVPYDREYNTLSCTAGGKQLVLQGGHSRLHEGMGRETAVLSLDSLSWESPESAQQTIPLLGHSSSVVGRNKLLVFGGSHGDEATSAVQQLSTDSMKWLAISPSSAAVPQARMCHAAAALGDKVYIFGGMTIEGNLLDDVWVLTDSMQWTHLQTYGSRPSARKGASLCATDNRLYLFGGHDGHGPLNDCAYLEVEQLCWSVLQPTGTPPEPREAHTAAVLGGRYLVVSGGCGVTAAPTATGTAALGSTAASGSSGAAGAAAAATAGLMGQPSAADSASTAATAAASGAAAVGGAAGAVPKRLTDTFVLDMFSGPCWEQLHDGGSVNAMWLKQMSAASAMHGNKVHMLQPNLHEQLVEMQVLSITLPEEIERLKSAKKRDQEQVDLELLDSVAATSSSIDTSWRPPTKNKDRITNYKLMLSSSAGVVREVYQGRATKFVCTGLKPAAEYVVSVKVSYDDGSALWSDSKAYRTKML